MLITYNHAKYIAQAIDSILAQETEFPFAIHVIDDCSTDGAQDIIRDYAARHPGKVKPFINKKNIGNKVTQKNFYRGMQTLDGDYIAILEGDDYWLSPQRLQAHVEFLEANPDFSACANHTLKVYEDGSQEPHLFQPPPPKDVHEIEDLIMLYSFFHASSLTFRNVFRGRVPHYFQDPLSCDIFVTIAHAQFGKIRFFNEAWSVYRAHSGGLFSHMSQTKGWMWNIDSFRACNRWLRFRYFPIFARTIWNYCDLLLANGREEDGFTQEKRREYTAIRRRYRKLEKAWHWLDVRLGKALPGWRPKSAPAKINMGCGHRQPLRMFNVDIRPEVDPDLVVDLERTPWPLPDDYAEEVLFDRALEHTGRDFDAFQGIMRELYRICRPGARVVIKAKHPWNNIFINDPTCVRIVSPAIISLFDRQTPATADPEPVAAKNGVDFEIIQRMVNLDEPYRSMFQNGEISEEEAARLIDSSLNVCSDFQIELQVHKPPRVAS